MKNVRKVLLLVALFALWNCACPGPTEPNGDKKEADLEPDIVVTDLSISTNVLETEAPFSLSFSVSNIGTDTGLINVLTVTISNAVSNAEAEITNIDFIESEEGIDLTIPFIAPSIEDTYFYQVCVSTENENESKISNNCTRVVSLTVEKRRSPDLVVSTPVADRNFLMIEDAFSLSVVVSNVGTTDADITVLNYYRSTDDSLSSNDILEEEEVVRSLGTNQGIANSIDINAPNKAGRYYYFACVDVVAGETNSNNNCSSAVVVEVLPPDLVVSAPSVSKTSLLFGEEFNLSVVVSNVGRTNAASSTLTYYRSTDAILSTDDVEGEGPDGDSLRRR